ncbi:STAS domain-containing protein [Methanofollis fontis]|uniref:Anti-sigma factor antagonist n=1 Tax=Methanofollis fontis TaxID=2052832 RepID=A0A483CPJ9_9EURY|nr:STAS domain-containing protein [Methanofollis fontis]TAJ44962.1 anti-sigma factor antagonist [Methanofollis fontis]
MDGEEIRIEGRREGATTVVCIGGRLDALSSTGAAEFLEETIRDGARWIVLDLSHLTYTSSSGLRAMLGALKEIRKHGGDLRIAAPIPSVRQVLDIAGFDRIIVITDTVEGAIRASENP